MSRPTLNALDAGLALLGLEVLRRLGLACPTDTEVLSFYDVFPEHVDDTARLMRGRISAYLVEGMLIAGVSRKTTVASPRR